MNTPNPNPRPPEPLTPEERELAARLAQLGPRGTPAPALDARIIAAAHAAAAGRVRPRQKRWPALLGLAATLALAIGVTWQLQPGGEVASRGEVPRERASAVATEAVADSAEPIIAPAGRQTPRLTGDVDHSGQEAVPTRVPGPRAAEPDLAPSAAPRTAKTAVTAIPAPPPPRPAPAAAPPAAAQSPLVAEQAIDAATPAHAQRETMARRGPESRAQSSAAPAPMNRATTIAGAAAVAAADDVAAVPVARDGELEPADWLERIRLRRDAGDLAGARESLRLLRRAHPQTVLPDDLQDLAESQLDQP